MKFDIREVSPDAVFISYEFISNICDQISEMGSFEFMMIACMMIEEHCHAHKISAVEMAEEIRNAVKGVNEIEGPYKK